MYNRDVALKCMKCGRPTSLFGWVDIQSGWEGWCRICNWRWEWDAILQFIDLLPLPRLVRICVSEFLVDKAALESIYAEAKSMVWSKLLLWDRARVRDPITNLLRELDTDDESEHGTWSPHHNFVKLFWKLQLSRDIADRTLFDRVIVMLDSLPSSGVAPVRPKLLNMYAP